MKTVCLQQNLSIVGGFFCTFASSMRLDRAATLQRWDDGNILTQAHGKDTPPLHPQDKTEVASMGSLREIS